MPSYDSYAKPYFNMSRTNHKTGPVGHAGESISQSATAGATASHAGSRGERATAGDQDRQRERATTSDQDSTR